MTHAEDLDAARLRHHVAVLQNVKLKRATLAEMEAESRAWVEDYMDRNGYSLIGAEDDPTITRKRVVSHRVDLKALRAKYPIEAATCTTATETWRFQVH